MVEGRKKKRKVKRTLKLLAWPLEWRVNVIANMKNPGGRDVLGWKDGVSYSEYIHFVPFLPGTKPSPSIAWTTAMAD